jgi:bifunctional DNase/RNase
MKDEALKLALEALEFNQARWQGKDEAITAIKQALEQTEKQKPNKFDLMNESFELEEANQARVREFMRNH